MNLNLTLVTQTAAENCLICNRNEVMMGQVGV